MKNFLFGILGLLFSVPAVADTLPAGYTELQYIESTGTQYIAIPQRQYVLDEEIIIDWAYTSFIGNFPTIYGSFSSEIYTDTSGSVINYGAIQTSEPQTFILNQKQTIKSKFTGSVETTQGLFAYYQGSTSFTYNGKGKLYKFIDRLNGVDIYNMIPAKRNSDNVIGMYDTVSGTFFTNAGTGSFTAGPEVSIRIATTAYNSARFSPVVTELNDTIATIRSVVTNTINQTKAIADLQATKQTRPNENCPAGKKCLLVEDNDGQPHWYEIIESPEVQ